VGCVFSAVHDFLSPVIRQFREQHPGVMVRIIEEGADALARLSTVAWQELANYPYALVSQASRKRKK